jgi:anti-sigma factor RsiW
MNDHDSLRESLVLHLAGELAPEESEVVRAHLEACSACREEAAGLAALAPPAALSAVAHEPEGFRRWRAGVLAETTAHSRGRTFARRALAAAAVFLLGLGAGVLATRSTSSSSGDVPLAGVRAPTPSAFSLPHPPPESRPSGFLSLASHVFGR